MLVSLKSLTLVYSYTFLSKSDFKATMKLRPDIQVLQQGLPHEAVPTFALDLHAEY